MENSYQNSTTAQIIDAIINQLSFEGESKSDIADILLSILNQTPYEKEPSSVIAELFIKLKAKIEGESFEPFDKPYISNIAEIIKSILDETEYNNAPNSRIAELLLELKEELETYVEYTVTGAIASFITNVSKPLVSCEVGESATKVYQRGANLFNVATKEDNKALVWTSGATFNENKSVVSDFIAIKEGYKYTSQYFAQVLVYDRNKNYIGNVTSYGTIITTSGNSVKTANIPSGYGVAYVRLGFRSTENGNEDMTQKTDITISVGNTAMVEAYNPNSQDYDVADIGNINTLVGVNNIFTDNGDLSVTYKAKETD